MPGLPSLLVELADADGINRAGFVVDRAAANGGPHQRRHRVHTAQLDDPECVARALALLTAADAHVDHRELTRLDNLDAYRRVGVTRARFIALAQACREEVGERLCDKSWMTVDDIARIDSILEAVQDRQWRLLVCRLAAAAITADGCVSDAERMVFDYMLGYWHVNRSTVSDAILHDPLN
jgi:hypothetical protein